MTSDTDSSEGDTDTDADAEDSDTDTDADGTDAARESADPDVPREAAELLTSEPRVAFLGTCHDDCPHVAPLWYNYRAGVVEIATTGRKLANLRENPKVALSVQSDEGGHPEWGIAVQGRASVVEDPDEAAAVLRRINRRYGAEDDAWSENTPVRIDVGHVEHWEY